MGGGDGGWSLGLTSVSCSLSEVISSWLLRRIPSTSSSSCRSSDSCSSDSRYLGNGRRGGSWRRLQGLVHVCGLVTMLTSQGA